MVLGLVEALRSVTAAVLLGVGFMYVWSIVFTQWTISYGSKGKCLDEGLESEICLNYFFGTLGKSFLSFTQILVFDDTFELVRPIIKENFIMGMLIILYILLNSFTILSMLIGIICDIVNKTTKREKQKELETRIKILFENIDTDGSKCLSREEFDGEAKEALLDLGLDEHIVEHVFDLSDFDRSGTLDLQEFMSTITLCTSPPSGREVQQVFSEVERVCGAVGLDSNTTAILKREKTARSVARSKSTMTVKSRNEPAETTVASDLEKVRDQFSKFQAIIYRAELDTERRARLGNIAFKASPPLLPPHRAKWFRNVKAALPKLCSQLHALRAEYRFARSRHTGARDIHHWQLDEYMVDVLEQIDIAMGKAASNGISDPPAELQTFPPVVEDMPVALTTNLTAAALPGSSVLEVEDVAGFAVGDHILVGSAEIKTISAISPITVSTPLTMMHAVGTVIRKLHVNDTLVSGAPVDTVPKADPRPARQHMPRTDSMTGEHSGSEDMDISSEFDVSSVPTDGSFSEVANKFSTRQMDAGGGAFAVNEAVDMDTEQVAVFPAYSDGELVEYYGTSNHEWTAAEMEVKIIKEKQAGRDSYFMYNARCGKGAVQVKADVTVDLLRLPPREGDEVEVYKLDGGNWVAAKIYGQQASNPTSAGYVVQLSRGGEIMQRVPGDRIRYRYKRGDNVFFYHSPEVGWLKAIVDRGASSDGCGAQDAGLDLASRKFHASYTRNSPRDSAGELTFAPRQASFEPKVSPWTLVPIRSEKSHIKKFAETVPSYYLRPQTQAPEARILMPSSTGKKGGGLLGNLRKIIK